MSHFSFAGEHSTLYNVRLLKSEETILPPTRDRTIALPGRHGALRLLPILGERHIILECWLDVATIPFTDGQRQERLRGVAAWLNPLRGVQRLSFDNDPTRYYDAVITAMQGVYSRTEAHQGLFSIEFVCSDPFFYAITPDTVVTTVSPLAHTQRGTAPADPLLRLQGVSTGMAGQQISISIGAQTVTYRGALAVGNWLEIDCRDKTAVRVVGQTRTRVLNLLERPVFPQLAPGANTITVTPAGGASWARLEISCRNRWL